MLAAIALLMLLNVVVWALELLKPYRSPDARTKSSGLLLVLYMPVWAVISNILLALAYPLFYGRSYFQHDRSAITGVWVSLLLAFIFMLLHRPLLLLLGRCILRNRPGLWGSVSAVFGATAGLSQYLIVRNHVQVGSIALFVFCVTSSMVGYCVGYV